MTGVPGDVVCEAFLLMRVVGTQQNCAKLALDVIFRVVVRRGGEGGVAGRVLVSGVVSV